MAVDDDSIDQKISFAPFDPLWITIIIAFSLWELYRCLRRPSRSRSFTDHILHPPAPTRNSPLHPSLFVLLPTSAYSSAAAAARADEHSQAPRECAICLDEFKEGDLGRVLPNCDHFFHLDCIDNWLRTTKNCPLCREVVKPPRRISTHENAEASAGEGQVNLPPPIWCPRNTRHQAIESEQVVIEIPEEDYRRSQRQSTSLQL